MRALLFYLLAAIAAALMIGVSLGPRPYAPGPAPQAGASENGWLAFGPRALARAEAGLETHIFAPRDGWGPPTGLRLVVKAGSGPPSEQSQGVRLQLAPEAAQGLGPGPFTVEVDLKPLGVTNAETLRLGTFDGATTRWSEPQPTATDPKTLTFTAPATASGNTPVAIAFWPQSQRADLDFGVEIDAVRIRPAG